MVGRLEQNINFARIGLKKLTPEYVARIGLRNLGRRASVVTGLQYKFFNFLIKWLTPRSTGAWIFGSLMKIAFNDDAYLRPILEAEVAVEPVKENRALA